MDVRIFQVDAFADRLFSGNPAAVMLFDAFPDDALMARIAAENNLAETAFLVPQGDDFALRWFTPEVEVPLCGHATLASAAVVLDRLDPGRTTIAFHTKSGILTVARQGDTYVMDFPSRPMVPVDILPQIDMILGAPVREMRVDAFNYLTLLDSAQDVRRLSPDIAAIKQLDRAGLIVTAPGDADFDMVSRYFAPAKGIDEDPVTGGAHVALAPYWAAKLGKQQLHAYQASARGGVIDCALQGDRVLLSGQCAFFMEGWAKLPC